MTQPDSASDAEATFCVMVRERRALLRLTQDEVRRRLQDSYGIDLSKTAMSRLEAGVRPIRLNEVFALAQLLEIDLAVYGRPAPATHHDQAAWTSQLQELSTALAEASAGLEAIDREVAVTSRQTASARAALTEAEHRLKILQTRHQELRRDRDRLAKRFVQALDAKDTIQRKAAKHGDR